MGLGGPQVWVPGFEFRVSALGCTRQWRTLGRIPLERPTCRCQFFLYEASAVVAIPSGVDRISIQLKSVVIYSHPIQDGSAI